MTESTAELVQAIIGGEVHRFAEIVQCYDGLVRRTVARRVRDADAREELVQETFYRAFKSLDLLEDPARLEPWLLRIAERRVLQHERSAARRRSREEKAARPVVSGPEPGTWIWEETARLPVRLADVLFLRYRLGLSYSEIADRLRIPPSTVRGRLHEARKQLRAELEKRGLQP